nr:hypothetical protein [Chloroflexota bacterium]
AGQQAAVAGVRVTNGAAGAAPTYTFLDGTAGFQPTREYEICLKCHSGFTVLPSNTTPVVQPPSRMTLDKGLELNPANVSYHPVEAAGTNPNTTIVNASLGGTSPYKQWTFTSTSTIRCVSCHGDPRKYNAATPPAAGSDLAPHTSPNRGLLFQPYRDRVLKSATEAYAAADFALCYVCHAEEPFTNSGSMRTRFQYHRLHVSGIANKGTNPSTNIDTPGAGQGRATCAECHFRIHSTALRTGAQAAAPRLVNFAPNVTTANGTVSFVPKPVGGGSGSCTLTCHGQAHTNETY